MVVRMRSVREVFAIALAVIAIAGAVAYAMPSPTSARSAPLTKTAALPQFDTAALDATLDQGATDEAKPDVRTISFRSDALGRAMPYSVYLPPGYDTSSRRYPVIYMLHGMSRTNDEWRAYGMLDTAKRMLRSHALRS